jgi:hypothetical protein
MPTRASLPSRPRYTRSHDIMTSRGRVPTPPPIPIEPWLITRPVPRRRGFATRAFGPGSAPELITRQYTSDMAFADRRAPGPSYGRNGIVWYPELDDLRKLLEHIDKWADCEFHEDGRPPGPVDGTWGYHVFLTSYDAATREKLELAMTNWVRIVQRHIASDSSDAPDDKKEELRVRFKFELVEDEEELSDASDDRVRENFRALMRNLDLRPDEDRWPPQARYNVCLVLDAAAVEMLAGLQIPDKESHRQTGLRDPDQEYSAYRKMTIKAIDANWDREDGRWSSYRGVGQVSINGLQELYLRITGDACNKAMEDLHPLDGWPGDNW